MTVLSREAEISLSDVGSRGAEMAVIHPLWPLRK